MKKVDLYTDGACSGNPGAGGWASILIYNGIEKILKYVHNKDHLLVKSAIDSIMNRDTETVNISFRMHNNSRIGQILLAFGDFLYPLC